MKSRVMWLVTLSAVLFAGPACATGCDLIVAAQLKAKDLPVHAMLVMTVDGKTTMNEYIAVDGKKYTRRREGGWNFKPITDIPHKWDWATLDCTLDGTATIKGETTDIVHYRGTSSPMDFRFWISRASGLTLRTEMTMGGSIVIGVNDYTDIQAPADAVPAPEQ